MKKNLISIIIPYHKKKKYFQQTIKSIQKQTYSKFELIIIYDDSSKIELNFVKKIIKNFKNKTLIINRANIGAGLSRNKGIRKSKGQFIAFCDADDIWHPTKLETQIIFMKKYNLSFCHSSYDIINDDGKKISHFIVKKKIDYNELLKCCDIGLSTVMCKKQILKKNSFSNTITKEDYFLWLNLILKTKFFFGIKKKLVSWRKLDNSLSSPILQRFKDAFIMYSMHSKNLFLINAYYTLRLSIYALIKKIKIYY